jgi:hypothetical protein
MWLRMFDLSKEFQAAYGSTRALCAERIYATDEKSHTSKECRKTQSRIGKHGSLRTPVRS